ncbi:MAG: MFS transporter [Alistipes sp.]|nr:MFS transporter [Rikenellaceae bacterium]MBO5189252.1 MFS transporter [Alistipes sp.]
MKKRNIVLLLLVLISVVTFLDRINITMASQDIMTELGLSESQWGWVLSVFTISYGLMQVPLGVWGDKRGYRLVLALIVLWWSLFTGLTGLAWSFGSLLVIRFMFGIGEAGSYPCMTGVVVKWYKQHETSTAQGYIWAASRMGGALTPFIVLPVLTLLGWHWAFYLLAAVGVVWAAGWYFWFRDKPAEVKGITDEELATLPEAARQEIKKVAIPWRRMMQNRQFWLILAMYFFYAWGSWFFFSWFPRFMEVGRGFDKSELTYVIAIPFVMSMVGNIAGGYLSSKLSLKYGLKVGRRLLGVGGLAVSALFMFLAAFIPGKTEVFIFLSLAFGVIDLMLPSAWAICSDIGGRYSGAVSGAMNTAGNIGGFVCATAFGYLIEATGNYNVPLFVITAMLAISALLFFAINPTKQLVEE